MIVARASAACRIGIGLVFQESGLILGLRPANERHRYKITPSLIDWVQTKNQPLKCSGCDSNGSVQYSRMAFAKDMS